MIRKSFALAGILLALAAVIATAPINAHNPEMPEGITDGEVFHCPDGTDSYVVWPGDTLWGKEGADWERSWGTLKELNPHIDFNARRNDRSADDIFVLLKPGESICGLRNLSFGIRNEDFVNPAERAPGLDTATPSALYEPERDAASTPPPGVVSGDPALKSAPIDRSDNHKGALILLLGVLLILFGIIALFAGIIPFLAMRRERMNHPATYGPPQVPGGIGHLGQEDVVEFMHNRVVGRFGFSRCVEGPHRVRLINRWRFKYADGKTRVGVCSGREEDRAYRAVYQLAIGGTHELFTLIACGNDGVCVESIGSTWVPDPIPQPAPPPAPQ